ncbi:hypothetical protein EUA79_00445 [TM7 phylum sp. oral taxon 351]|nr:hypothetical protein EUA79_00445 [TM7 phylum sp. oral taxon 351]
MENKIDPKQVRGLDRNIEKIEAIADIRDIDTETLKLENHTLKVIASSSGQVTKTYVDDLAKSSQRYVDGKIGGLSSVATTGNYSDLKGRPTLSRVATTGQFNDLEGVPALGSVEVMETINDLPENGEDGTTYLVKQNVTARLFVDIFYPVGTYYETSDSNFNPNVAWGGTWVEGTKGRVLVAIDKDIVGFNTIGKTGGEKEHILTIDEIPKHQHKMSLANYSGTDSVSGVVWSPNTSKKYIYSNDMVEPVGGGLAHNNMPPYVVVKRWHRTK